MSVGGEACWQSLKEDLEVSAAMIDVGEEGWERRFEAVVSGMLPLRGVGRRLVALALIGELERDGKRKGLELTEEMFRRLETMERSYGRREKLEKIWEENGPERSKPDSRWGKMTVLEQVAEDEKMLAADGEKGGFIERMKSHVGGGLFDMVASAVSLIETISR